MPAKKKRRTNADRLRHYKKVQSKNSSAWWKSLSDKQKKAYLKKHPNSKFNIKKAKAKAKSKPKKRRVFDRLGKLTGDRGLRFKDLW